MSETTHNLKRSLGVTDMTLFTVSAILLLDTLSASASIGVSSITWWVILSVFFFVPYGLISAELGTTYPEQGGIYAWVRDAFGARWGTRVTWLYWLNNVLWHASLYVLFAGIFAQMFFPDLSSGAKLVMAYAATFKTLTDDQAAIIVGEYFDIQKNRLELMDTYALKLSKGLPAKKVFRYLQIENKIDVGARDERAKEIPLAE